MSDLIEAAVEALKQVFDPEAGLNIVDLGLIYAIRETLPGVLEVDMTFTTESCPAGPYLTGAAQSALDALSGVVEARIAVVFDPPWTPERVTLDGRAWLSL